MQFIQQTIYFFNRYAKMTGKSAILAKNGINMPPYQKDA